MLLAHDIDRYFTFVDDLEAVVCFLNLQEMGEVPRNMHQPMVDVQVLGQPA